MKTLVLLTVGVLAGMLAFAAVVSAAQEPEKTGGDRMKTATPGTRVVSASGHDLTPLTKERIAELAKGLTADEARVILNQGTEAPFCGNLLD